jgi:hypothetical protein
MSRLALVLSFLAGSVACTAGAEPETGSTTEALQWWTTCGDPVCQGYTGPFAGVPLCTTAAEGDACEDGALQCDPENVCNALLVCAAEDPKAQTGGCPISAAAAKRDIAYLDAPAQDALLQQVVQTRLATWAYTDDDPGATRLGFILDDGPPDAAVRPGGERVDLYGYTSVAVGAIQAQQRRLDAQAAELAALRAELDALKAGACPAP